MPVLSDVKRSWTKGVSWLSCTRDRTSIPPDVRPQRPIRSSPPILPEVSARTGFIVPVTVIPIMEDNHEEKKIWPEKYPLKKARKWYRQKVMNATADIVMRIKAKLSVVKLNKY